MPKSSRKIKMSQKQKQSTKQSVIVNVKNVINERRRRAKPAPAPKQDTRDSVMLQPKASMFGNNLLTGNVSRYVQPAMSFAVAPPQFQPIQSAIMDKPIAKVVPPKQRPDIIGGEEIDPYDMVKTPKKAPDLPDMVPKGPYVPRVGDLAVVGKMTPENDSMFTPIDLASSSASASGFIYAPQPPPPPSPPKEEMGPAQAFGAPAIPMAQVILPEEKDEVPITPAQITKYMKDKGYNFPPGQTYLLLDKLGLDTRNISRDGEDWNLQMDAVATSRLYNYLKTRPKTDLKATLKDILDKEQEKDMKIAEAKAQAEARLQKTQQELAELAERQKPKKSTKRNSLFD